MWFMEIQGALLLAWVTSVHSFAVMKVFCLSLWMLYYMLRNCFPRFVPQELEHLKRFNLTWELHNKHLFHSIIYTDPVVQNSLPLLITQLRYTLYNIITILCKY